MFYGPCLGGGDEGVGGGGWGVVGLLGIFGDLHSGFCFFPFFPPLSERTPHQIFTPDMKGCFIQARFQEIEKTAVSKV